MNARIIILKDGKDQDIELPPVIASMVMELGPARRADSRNAGGDRETKVQSWESDAAFGEELSAKEGVHPRAHRSLGPDTTMIYTHIVNMGGQGVPSPLDRLP